MSDHGGKRVGAGRPKLYNSKRMSVPNQLVPKVTKLIEEYKDLAQRAGGKYNPNRPPLDNDLETSVKNQDSEIEKLIKSSSLDETNDNHPDIKGIPRSTFNNFPRLQRKVMIKEIKKGKLRIIEGK